MRVANGTIDHLMSDPRLATPDADIEALRSATEELLRHQRESDLGQLNQALKAVAEARATFVRVIRERLKGASPAGFETALELGDLVKAVTLIP